MGSSVYKFNGEGDGALALSAVVPAGRHYRVYSVTLHMSAAPSTGENFTITLDSAAGAVFDTVLYSLDLSTGSTTDLFWYPAQPLILEAGDALDLAYANTDVGHWAAQITMGTV